MKKRIIILLLFLVSLIQAQDNYMALSFGGGIPIADFKNHKNIYTDGYANTGFLAEYTGVYYPIDYIGFAGAARFTTNMLKTEEVIRDLIALVPDEVSEDLNARLDVGKWDVISLTVGPQFTLPAGKVEFDLYFLAGINIINSPKLEFTAAQGGGDYFYSNLYTQNVRFGVDAGFNIRINLNEKSGLRLFVGYQHTSVSGELEIDAPQGEDSRKNYEPKIDLINSGIGLIYRL